MNNHKTYECVECTKIYKSYMGYWKHNKKYHQSILDINVSQSKPEVSQSKPEVSQSKPEVSQSKPEVSQNKLDVFIKNKCKFCNKILSCKQSKYKHEKICKTQNDPSGCLYGHKNKKEFDKKQNNKNEELQILKNEIEQLSKKSIDFLESS